VKAVEISEYQRRAQASDTQKTGEDALIVPLLGLAGETGTLLSSYKKWLRDGDAHKLFKQRVIEDLGDILWYLANVAEKMGVNLEDAAEANLRKVTDRFGPIGAPSEQSSFDEDFPEEERLPVRFTVTFEDKRSEGRNVLRVKWDGVQAGDFLTDNAYEADGYRFHDAFHFTYATILGWSPVTRHILRRKRKSDAMIDNVEDGGRARVFEEGISALVFERARHHGFFRDVDFVDYDLLSTIRSLVSAQEVRVRTASEWERAILEGFRIWRLLNENGGGTVEFDRTARTMTYSPPVAISATA
jgi:NTP pyrophosphatase (non-canonical NTP hydrolase)